MNEPIARAVLERLNEHDLEGMLAFAAEDELQHLPMDGRIDIRGMDGFSVRDGRVASVFAACGSMDLAVQAGLLPPIGTPSQRAMVHAIDLRTATGREARARVAATASDGPCHRPEDQGAPAAGPSEIDSLRARRCADRPLTAAMRQPTQPHCGVAQRWSAAEPRGSAAPQRTRSDLRFPVQVLRV